MAIRVLSPCHVQIDDLIRPPSTPPCLDSNMSFWVTMPNFCLDPDLGPISIDWGPHKTHHLNHFADR